MEFTHNVASKLHIVIAVEFFDIIYSITSASVISSTFFFFSSFR